MFERQLEKRPERLREMVQRYGVVIAPLLAISAILIVMFSSCNDVPGHYDAISEFFVDETTLEPVLFRRKSVAPMPGPSGSESAVVGVYFTFGAPEQKQLVYLRKYDPAGKRLLEANRGADGYIPISIWMEAEKNALVSRLNSSGIWVRLNSEEGRKIIAPPVDAHGRPASPVMP
jgi:hypothetical protein